MRRAGVSCKGIMHGWSACMHVHTSMQQHKGASLQPHTDTTQRFMRRFARDVYKPANRVTLTRASATPNTAAALANPFSKDVLLFGFASSMAGESVKFFGFATSVASASAAVTERAKSSRLMTAVHLIVVLRNNAADLIGTRRGKAQEHLSGAIATGAVVSIITSSLIQRRIVYRPKFFH